MKNKDLIEMLLKTVEDLKEFDPEIEAKFIGEHIHTCCGEGCCYLSNETSEIYSLGIRKDNRKNKKSNKMETVGIVLVAS